VKLLLFDFNPGDSLDFLIAVSGNPAVQQGALSIIEAAPFSTDLFTLFKVY
tara:strand:+ start:13985 stop:14137 length:153 start_codon:yes stop_codon:yes gene_type:complete